MKEVFVIEGIKHSLTAKVEGSEVVANTEEVKAIEDAVKHLEVKAAKVAELETVIEALKAEIETLRAPFEADIVNGQKALEVAEADRLNDEALKGFSAAKLIEKAAAISASVVSTPAPVVTKSASKLPWQA